MIDKDKIVLDKVIDIENLKKGKLIALDVQNEYISYLKYKAKWEKLLTYTAMKVAICKTMENL